MNGTQLVGRPSSQIVCKNLYSCIALRGGRRLLGSVERPDPPREATGRDGNNAKLYGIQPKRAMLELSRDRFAAMKAEYEKAGPEPSNMRYGYVVPSGPVDYSVFT
jgi:hypothetical protein